MNNKGFTIRIFVPEGDPDGVRVIDRLNSTGIFTVFPRVEWGEVKKRKPLDYSGIYILSGYQENNDELPTIYVGQADTVRRRIEEHLKKKMFWDKAIIFTSPNLNSTHARWLEYILIKRAIEAGRCVLDNGNSPQEPTIAESDKVDMLAVLEEIYQTLPLAGLRAFEMPVDISSQVKQRPQDFKNTIVVPAQKEGFESTFLRKDSWHAVRISGGKLGEIKYIAGYQAAPISAITHVAEVKQIIPYGEDGKYELVFANAARKLNSPIPLGDNATPGLMQGPRYTSYSLLEKANTVMDLFV